VLQAENSKASLSSTVALDLVRFKTKLEQQLSKPAAANEIEDALHLAAALTNPTAAHVASAAVLESDCFVKSRSQMQLSLQAVQQLMQIATARCLVRVLIYAAAQPAAAQIPEAAMYVMVRTALGRLVAKQSMSEETRASQTLHILCRAAALDEPAAVALLETALQLPQRCRFRPAVMTAVMSIAAVKHLGANALEQVMLAALQAETSSTYDVEGSGGLGGLTKLPGAQQLSGVSLQLLLKAALRYGSQELVCSLLRLPAVKQLSAEAVAHLLQLAVRSHNRAAGPIFGAMVQPKTVPAAAELDSAALVQLAEAAAAAAAAGGAAERALHSNFRLLLWLPCLQQADAQQLRLIVLAARDVYCGPVQASSVDVETAMKSLLEAPAVEQLPADAAAALLAVSVRYCIQIRKVSALQSAAEMTQQQLQPVLLSVMQQLCSMANEGGSSRRQRERDSMFAAATPNMQDAVQLFLLPAARRLDSAAVAALLAAAADHTTTRASDGSGVAVERHRQALKHVCHLPGAQRVRVQQLTKIIQAITSSELKRGSSNLAAALCELTAAASLGREVVGSLLTTALQRQWHMAVGRVCGLRGAQELTAAEVEPLLWQVLRESQKLRAEFVPYLKPDEREQLVWQEQWLYQAGEALYGTLAAAQQLGADVVERLLQRVVGQRLHAYVPVLCDLAGSHKVSSAAVAALLRQTIGWALDAQQQQQHVPECVADLCSLAGARQLDAAAVVALLTDAVLVRCGAAAVALCELPAAARLAESAVQELKQLAAQCGDVGLFQALQLRTMMMLMAGCRQHICIA
jgi:hypothetical protein